MAKPPAHPGLYKFIIPAEVLTLVTGNRSCRYCARAARRARGSRLPSPPPPAARFHQMSPDLKPVQLSQARPDRQFWGNKMYFVVPVILRLCHLWSGTDASREFISLMPSDKISNRPKKVLQGAANDAFPRRPCPKSGPAYKMLQWCPPPQQ